MFKKVLTVIGVILSGVGAVSTIYKYLQNIKNEPKLPCPPSNPFNISDAQFALIVMTILFIFTLAVILKYRKSMGYEAAFKDISVGFSEMHSIDRISDDNLDINTISHCLLALCTQTAEAFLKAKGHKCGVSIKLISLESDTKVYTFARDQNSLYAKRPFGIETTAHAISENTDYKTIYNNFNKENEDKFFVSKNLLFKKEYENSRITRNEKWQNRKKFKKAIRILKWPYSYRSTIVVPILPIINSNSESSIIKIRGFLCVDSPRISVFTKGTDLEIMRGIADGLFNKIPKVQTAIQSYITKKSKNSA